MPFALTDEQKLLQESVDRFVERDYGFDIRTRLADGEPGWGAENWATFAELGWLGVPFPEAAGGHGGGPVEAGIIAEALGKGLAVEPYLWTVVLGGGLLARAGRSDLLGALIAGKCNSQRALPNRRGATRSTMLRQKRGRTAATGR